MGREFAVLRLLSLMRVAGGGVSRMPVAGHVEYSVRQGPAIVDAGVGADRLARRVRTAVVELRCVS